MSSRAKSKQANQVVRAQLAREDRKRRLRIVMLIAGAVIVVAGFIGWGVWSSQKSTKATTPVNATAGGVGLPVGGAGGKAKVELYVDFMCPACKAFEQAAGPTLNEMMAAGRAEVILHPVAILDDASTTNYSTRASAAAGCASDGGKLNEYATALYAQQPPEGGDGLPDDQLIQIGRDVGLSDTFAQCVTGGTYLTWVPKVTAAASERGLRGTPTAFVNDKQIESTVEALTAAVNGAVG
ncbi:thioredoxin domain-containing protein [Luedemannella flava]|uniref:Thioredoxin domain-containing protein n=1 Tax=Luedemannella flava TaxID=349316 RepID=A0ABP4YAP2_9ACTN